MNSIIAILQTLLDPTKSALLYCGTFSAGWVNDKPGPKITTQTFQILLSNNFITPLDRVTKFSDGPWYTISDEGKIWLQTVTQKKAS